jgi:UDP-glucose 4-epimerase
VDIVFHLAANPDIAAAEKTPDIDFWAGTYLTQNVLEAMRLTGVSRLFYSSGIGVYGEAEIELEESHGPSLPISTYGASKLACVAMIGSYCHMFGQRARVLRFANVVGARQTHGVGFDFLNKLASNPEELNVLGDGTQTKSYIHVSDVISAIDLMIAQLMDDKAIPFDVFNVSTIDTVRVKEIAELAVELASPRAKIKFGDSTRGWKGDVPRVKFNSTKIGQLGWFPRMSSLEAVTASLLDMKSQSHLNRKLG